MALLRQSGKEQKRVAAGGNRTYKKKPWKESRALKACSSGWWICLYPLYEQTGFLIDEQAGQTE